MEASFCTECGTTQPSDPPEESLVGNETDGSDGSLLDTLGKVASWGFGGLFVLVGIAGAISDPAPGIAFLAVGLFLLPVVREQLEDVADYELPRAAVIGIAVVGLIAAGAVVPSTDTTGATTNGDAGAAATATDTPIPTEEPADFAVRVKYTGSWSGAISVTGGGASETRSISGTGSRIIEIDGTISILSANAQKKDDSSSTLTIQILHKGEVVAESSTSSSYGVAQTSKRF